MAVAIVLGILVGIIGYVPHMFVIKKAKSVDPTNTAGYMGWFFLAVALSFVILIGCALACKFIVQDVAVPFVIAEFLSFVVAVIVLGVVVPRVKK